MKTCVALFALVALSLIPCACQNGGKAEKPVGKLEKVLGSSTEDLLRSIRSLGNERFLSLREGKTLTSRAIHLEDRNGHRAVYSPGDKRSLIRAVSDVSEGKLLFALITPSKETETSEYFVSWVEIEAETGREVFRVPFRDGRGAAVAVTFAGDESPIALRALPDGGFAALVASRDGVRIHLHDRRGEFLSAEVVVPAVAGSPRSAVPLRSGFLRALPSGELYAVTKIFQHEVPAVEAQLGQKLHSALTSPLDQLIVILKLSASGKTLAATTVDIGNRSADITALDFAGNVLAIAGNYDEANSPGKAFAAIVAPSGDDLGAKRSYVLFNVTKERDQAAGIVCLPGRGILFAGNSGLVQAATHSIVAHGAAFLSFLDENGKETAFQWIEGTSLHAVMEVFQESGSLYLLGAANPPMTHGDGKDLTTALYRLRLD